MPEIANNQVNLDEGERQEKEPKRALESKLHGIVLRHVTFGVANIIKIYTKSWS